MKAGWLSRLYADLFTVTVSIEVTSYRAVYSRLKWYEVQKNGSMIECVQVVAVELENERNEIWIMNHYFKYFMLRSQE